MDLLVASITTEAPELMENGVRILMIGDIDGLPENCAESLKNLITETQDNTSLTLILALNYSAKWELKMAIKSIAHAINTGALATNEITDDLVSHHLSTKGIPDPELLIRTSGERRISNFLLWQIAYAELYFTDTHWPDFRRNDLISAVIEYQNRERRFGKLSIQLEAKK
jgi:undecaprenyl diphosphate synthase